MTIIKTSPVSGPYLGNGSVKIYDYTFKIQDKSQISVYETDDKGVQTKLVLDVDYTVSDIGDSNGGTVTRVSGNLPTGYVWYIRSNYVPDQRTTFDSQTGFFPKFHEEAFDKLSMLSQQLNDILSRSPSVDIAWSEGILPLTIDDPIAENYMKWKTDLSGLENFDIEGDYNGKISELADHVNESLKALSDYVNENLKALSDYVDATFVEIDGDTMKGTLNLGNNTLTGLPSAILAKDAVNLKDLQDYVAGRDIPGSDVLPLSEPEQLGDGSKLEFSTPSDVFIAPEAFFVTFDGVMIPHWGNYTILQNGNIKFTTAPLDGVTINIVLFKPFRVIPPDRNGYLQEEHSGDGTSLLFLKPFGSSNHNQDHIVTIDGVAQEANIDFIVSNDNISFDDPPPNLSKIVIRSLKSY